ncbi:MAG: hypothetical protein Q8941_24140 [Bacteroidota bacterium]|nr:hypothetical protein [Bacteroidota bacterium]
MIYISNQPDKYIVPDQSLFFSPGTIVLLQGGDPLGDEKSHPALPGGSLSN